MEVTAPHHLRGAIWVGHHHALPACRHDPAWRNTGLRTAATPRGVANYLASCNRMRRDRHIGIPKQRRVRPLSSAMRASPLPQRG
ncbi:MAG: hypothetical protein SPE65_07870 [Muribaculaceae bacterium]|nr:hypothetical protein [Muribaculaceae bacterium]